MVYLSIFTWKNHETQHTVEKMPEDVWVYLYWKQPGQHRTHRSCLIAGKKRNTRRMRYELHGLRQSCHRQYRFWTYTFTYECQAIRSSISKQVLRGEAASSKAAFGNTKLSHVSVSMSAKPFGLAYPSKENTIRWTKQVRWLAQNTFFWRTPFSCWIQRCFKKRMLHVGAVVVLTTRDC